MAKTVKFEIGKLEEIPNKVLTTLYLGAGMGLVIGLAFLNLGGISSNVTAQSIAKIFAQVIAFIAMYEIADATILKDAYTKVTGTLTRTQQIVTYAIIGVSTFIIIGLFAQGADLGSRIVVSVICGGYIAMDDTGDDLWLLTIAVACVIICFVTGWLSPQDWISGVFSLKAII